MFTVVYRDFYREHCPSKVDINASTKEEAIEIVTAWDNVKEILACDKNIVWNANTIKAYWGLYWDLIDESQIKAELENRV